MEATNRPLKIGFDAKRLFFNNTGLGNYSRTLVKNLKTYYPENEYHLFTPGIHENADTRFFLNEGFHIHTPPRFMPAGLWRTAGMSAQIKDLNLDIFHGLSHEIPFGLPSGTKKVLTIHDLIYEIYPDYFRWWDRWAYRQKYRSSCKRADAVIAISKATKEDLIKIYQIPESGIRVIYQSCSPEFQEPPAATPSKKHFLYVGTIEPRKSLLDVVHAYARMDKNKQIPFVVIGNGTDYLQEVHKALNYYGISSHFQFLGKQPNAALKQYYDQAMGLILPSVYEGFGIPIAEALFRGIPVITSPFSALPEAAGPGGILVDPKDHAALAEAMESLFDETQWNKLSNTGNAYVTKHFSSRTTAEQLHNFYRNLISTTDLKGSEVRL